MLILLMYCLCLLHLHQRQPYCAAERPVIRHPHSPTCLLRRPHEHADTSETDRIPLSAPEPPSPRLGADEILNMSCSLMRGRCGRANVAHGCDVRVVHTLCSPVRRGARAAVPARGQQHQDLLRPVHPHHARVGSGGRGQRGREKRIMTPPLQPATPISTNFFGVIFGLPLGAGGWSRAGPMRNRGGLSRGI